MSLFSILIHKEEELLKRLLLVSQKQMEIVREGNMTLLLEHLAQRQQLWNEFEELEEELKEHKAVPPEQRVWKTESEKQQTETSLNNCKVLLAEILVNDDISLNETATQKNEIEAQLKRVGRARNVVTAYVKHSNITEAKE
ncbi:hypothetical protein FACS189454_02230 [Planctomycetales bacterium]|nr:hypothetical protein FACS189454_02230 [Planctomycetales bacterium]